jgi:hypothetical protein
MRTISMMTRFGFFLMLALASSPLWASKETPDYALDPDIVAVVSGYGEQSGSFRIVVVNSGYEHVSSKVRLEWLETGPDQETLIRQSVWIEEIGNGMLSLAMPVLSPENTEIFLSATHTYSMEKYEFTLTVLEPGHYVLKEIKQAQ